LINTSLKRIFTFNSKIDFATYFYLMFVLKNKGHVEIVKNYCIIVSKVIGVLGIKIEKKAHKS